MSRTNQLRLLLGVSAIWLVWMGWSLSWGTSERLVQVVDATGNPITGVQAYVNEEIVGTTDTDGKVLVPWRRIGINVRLEELGYSPKTVRLGMGTDLDTPIRLESNLLRGRITDMDGKPVSDARVSSVGFHAESDQDGRFSLLRAEPGPVRVWKPAWQRTEFDWDGGPGRWDIGMEPQLVKSVHLSGPALSDPIRRDNLLGLSMSTELNALMIDLKDEEGLIWYDTQVSAAHDFGAVANGYNLNELVRQADEMGLYVIGRVVAFQDPIAAVEASDMSVWDNAVNAPFNKRNQWFLDPTDPDAREYAYQFGLEACQRGVDEIQFDYVRFPDGYPSSVVFDGDDGPENRVNTITGFLQGAREMLHPLECVVSADVFGFTTTVSDDGGIGQRWPDMARSVDVISPMLYPSHYDSGWFGYDDPNDHPAEVISRALNDGLERLDQGTVVRPWLQDFGYDSTQVRSSIDVVEELNLGWMLWNAASNVTTGALKPAPLP